MNYLSQVQKALVAAIVAFIVAQLQQHGLSPDMTLQDALQNVLGAIGGGLAVYFVPNKPKSKV